MDKQMSGRYPQTMWDWEFTSYYPEGAAVPATGNDPVPWLWAGVEGLDWEPRPEVSSRGSLYFQEDF